MEEILNNINSYSKEQVEEFIQDGVIDVEKIIDTLHEYDAVQIAQFINKGLIEFEDMEDNPEVDYKKRKKVEKLLEGMDDEPIEDDDTCFQKAKEQNTVPAYDEYLTKFPEGDHRQEAKELKKKLEKPTPPQGGEVPRPTQNPWARYEKPIDVIIKEKSRTGISDLQFVKELEGFLISGRLSRQQLIDLIQSDNNLFNRGVIKELVTKGWLTPDELIAAGIGDDFIYALYNVTDGPQIDPADNPTAIVNRSTEVYFWGIPSSGKSCVMAALMSVLKTSKIDDGIGAWEPKECKGSDYMNRLSMLYKENEVKVLLPGTPVASTYEMAFNLTRLEGQNPKRKKPYVHPFTFIDLAGGILFLMYDYLNRRNSMTDENKAYLDTIKDLIIGTSNDKKNESNRKMHCFVIEYGAETWSYNGYDQLTYLGEALRYIEETNIFKNKATDSIYVIVTKADRAALHGKQLNDEIKNYVENGYYKGFYDRLQGIAKKCEINGGLVSIVPFSIGEVKMRSLCKFNGKPARVLMEKLADRSIGFDESKWGKIIGGMVK